MQKQTFIMFLLCMLYVCFTSCASVLHGMNVERTQKRDLHFYTIKIYISLFCLKKINYSNPFNKKLTHWKTYRRQKINFYNFSTFFRTLLFWWIHLVVITTFNVFQVVAFIHENEDVRNESLNIAKKWRYFDEDEAFYLSMQGDK